MMSITKYYNTVRYLRASQIYGRLWHHFYRPGVEDRINPGLRAATAAWLTWHWRNDPAAGKDEFRFLNQTHRVRCAGDWDDPARPRLWRYNLHYFNVLGAKGAEARVEYHQGLIARWVAENPPTAGTAWEPYPTSLRLVNWIKWALAGRAKGEVRLDAQALHNLAMQTRLLCKKLEFHILGNHLWANAKALVFAGVFFEGPEASGWLTEGIRLLTREFAEQILADGGHFERSPMYHAIVLEDVVDLLNLGQAYSGLLPEELVVRLTDGGRRMLRWLDVMSHPDGRISFFNDATFGVAPTGDELREYAGLIGMAWAPGPLGTVEALKDSGYVRLQIARAVLICDVGPVGPDYLPGHAHADTLSFELSLNGQRLLVNTGISTYAAGVERTRQRSTAAHNTVEVDGQNSSETWGAFRVARRAYPADVRWGCEGEGVWLSAAHDGYGRLPGKAVHQRRWQLNEASLLVVDRLAGRFKEASVFLHFHPRAQVTPSPGRAAAVLFSVAGCARVEIEGAAAVSAERTAWHPGFGESSDKVTLRARFKAESLTTRVTWL